MAPALMYMYPLQVSEFVVDSFSTCLHDQPSKAREHVHLTWKRDEYSAGGILRALLSYRSSGRCIDLATGT